MTSLIGVVACTSMALLVFHTVVSSLRDGTAGELIAKYFGAPPSPYARRSVRRRAWRESWRASERGAL